MEIPNASISWKHGIRGISGRKAAEAVLYQSTSIEIEVWSIIVHKAAAKSEWRNHTWQAVAAAWIIKSPPKRFKHIQTHARSTHAQSPKVFLIRNKHRRRQAHLPQQQQCQTRTSKHVASSKLATKRVGFVESLAWSWSRAVTQRKEQEVMSRPLLLTYILRCVKQGTRLCSINNCKQAAVQASDEATGCWIIKRGWAAGRRVLGGPKKEAWRRRRRSRIICIPYVRRGPYIIIGLVYSYSYTELVPAHDWFCPGAI